jgi:adenylate cyclase
VNPKSFFGELKRRNIYKVAVAYAVVAWLLIQIATSTFPVLEIPNWAIKLVIALVVLGFPIALILAWAFELTPEGIKRAEDVVPNESITKKSGRKLIAFIIAVMALAVAVLLFQIYRGGGISNKGERKGRFSIAIGAGSRQQIGCGPAVRKSEPRP